ncbi:hypothetical protein VP1G_00257 [Cytospora mali]|uniref:Uncharacterized protein n=1 Tax=Cytospora mali TaxID=578113 RepID=A0A194UM06_CYTMA|nr:hypothetical protein VP1G_00257 [Valsa mali var. pyri (nom. inval.)]
MCKFEKQDIWCMHASCQKVVGAGDSYTRCRKAKEKGLAWGSCGKTDEWTKPAKKSEEVECLNCYEVRLMDLERQRQAMAREGIANAALEQQDRAYGAQRTWYASSPHQWPQSQAAYPADLVGYPSDYGAGETFDEDIGEGSSGSGSSQGHYSSGRGYYGSGSR